MLKSKKLFVIAGEESGDTHASNMLGALGSFFELDIYGTGGKKLLSLGQKQYYSSDDLAIVGFSEIFKNLKFLFSVRDNLKEKLIEVQPDAVILVDYPGFNLRFAKIAKELGFPVIYYISPQIWAWHYSRIEKIRKYVDLMLCILPFEKDMYEKEGVQAKFVGNPIVDSLNVKCTDRDMFCSKFGIDKNKKLIGILPGSRKKEVRALLSDMLTASASYNKEEYEFVFAMSENLTEDFIKEFVKGFDIKIVQGYTHDIMKYSNLLWICSGTATLEAAMFNTPMIIGYRGKMFEYVLYKLLARLKFLGLPNILANRFIVPELLQNDFTPENLLTFTEKVISDSEEIRKKLKILTAPFFEYEPSKSAAEEISSFLNSK